ncbi:AI-2E family transporter [Alkaliphilus oremlandii]|uniref:Permease n=1 Tax=Alkaliphilus oremlandii (strain OhILAs) TaxID=350688 RepID=A8ML02_ALKOO|nr:AI-2E family transporter [Alkaliphilus oremlandii]ABW17819.1 protein of unknown function UPF0118 [Alkaliphilus oremlandii OhILAs]
MKIKLDRQYFKYSFYGFLTIGLSILFYLTLINLGNFSQWVYVQSSRIGKVLNSVIIGISIAYILNPGVRWFETNVYNKSKKIKSIKKLPRALSIISVYLFLFSLIAMVIIFVVPQIGGNIIEISRRVPEYLNATIDFADELIEKWAKDLPSTSNLNNVGEYIEANINTIFSNTKLVLDYIFNNLIMRVMNITSGILNFVMGIIISFYLLGDKESFKKGTERILRAVFSKKTVDRVVDLGREADTIFGKFVVGKFIDSFIIGVLCFIGLTILKIKYGLLISVIIGITNMIPYFGPFIGAVPAVLITLFDSPINAIWVMIFIFILQQFDGLYLGPKILGDSVGISPFWIIFSIVLGGGLYGVLGMFLGVPVVAIITTFSNRLIDWQLERKEEKEHQENIQMK